MSVVVLTGCKVCHAQLVAKTFPGKGLNHAGHEDGQNVSGIGIPISILPSTVLMVGTASELDPSVLHAFGSVPARSDPLLDDKHLIICRKIIHDLAINMHAQVLTEQGLLFVRT